LLLTQLNHSNEVTENSSCANLSITSKSIGGTAVKSGLQRWTVILHKTQEMIVTNDSFVVFCEAQAVD